MSSIWNALVPETNKAVDKYFAQIVEEIATNLVRISQIFRAPLNNGS